MKATDGFTIRIWTKEIDHSKLMLESGMFEQNFHIINKIKTEYMISSPTMVYSDDIYRPYYGRAMLTIYTGVDCREYIYQIKTFLAVFGEYGIVELLQDFETNDISVLNDFLNKGE